MEALFAGIREALLDRSAIGDGTEERADARRADEPSARVLERDPELGLRIPARGITRARAQLVAPVQTLECGIWEVPKGGGRCTFLVLDGLLARDLVLAGTTCTELLGEGDVLDPSLPGRVEGLVRYDVLWHVLQPLRFAILDEQFQRALAEWPQVMGALLERTIRRTVRQSVHQALLQLSPVETRLVVLFWFLAERWGHVTPAGVTLRLRLTHQLIGQLVGVQRASVTTALRHVAAAGRVIRRSDGTWLLRGQAPGDLAHLHWGHGGTGSLGGDSLVAETLGRR